MREWIQINLDRSEDYRKYQAVFEESIAHVLAQQEKGKQQEVVCSAWNYFEIGIERICEFPIAPAVLVKGRQAQGAAHAVDLLAVLGGVVDDLQQNDPGLHVVAVRGLEPGPGKLILPDQIQQRLAAGLCDFL